MAPPIPLIIFPGIIQFAKSPRSDTSIPPRIATSMWPPRIMAKDSALSKYEAPFTSVMVSFPALIRSGSLRSFRRIRRPEQAVFRLKQDVIIIRYLIGYKRRHPYPQVHIHSVLNFFYSPFDHSFSAISHSVSLLYHACRTVRRSIRFS